MQFSVDARGITGLSAKALSMKVQFNPQVSLPTIKNSTPRGGRSKSTSIMVSSRNNSNPPVLIESTPKQKAQGQFYYDESGNPDPEYTPRTLAIMPSEEYMKRKPSGMSRAKVWSLEVENSFRYQLAGWIDISEYLSQYQCPEVWPDSGMIKCLQNKKSGYFMYFRQHRECEDKYLNRVKLYRR